MNENGSSAPIQVVSRTAAYNENMLCAICQDTFRDPVTALCGAHNFCKTCLTQHILACAARYQEPMCPTCRYAPIQKSPSQLHVNVALRDAALAPAPASGSGSGSGSGSAAAPVLAPAPAPAKTEAGPIQVKANRITGTDKVHISLSVPGAGSPDSMMPTLFIDVIDISGSMANSSVDTTTQAGSEAAAFSRADLVRHAVATQIELLRPDDELALVLFDNNATVPLQRTKMTPTGRAAAKACLSLIQPTGGTAIWAGLQRALTIASAVTDKNVVIVLQTDGESDPSYNPPRGIPDTFRGWLDANRATKVTVHTVGYGFGSALDMPLLRSLADIGGGTVNYIPDGSMVGTVFIHMMANLMSCVYRGVEIQISSLSRRIPVGFLQADQSRDFVITLPDCPPSLEITVTADNWTSMASTRLIPSTPSLSREEAAWPVIHENLIDELQKALTVCERGGSYNLAPMVAAATDLAVDPSVAAVLSDLADPDSTKGQLGKAFATRDAFNRWGRHYVPGVLSGHKNQWAINFKDESSKIYGSPATRALISRGEAIFTSLPPPTASCAPRTAYGGGGGGGAPITYSLSSFSQANYGGCFLPSSQVLMAGGGTKRCDEIAVGDIVDKGFRVACIVKTMVGGAGRIEIVRLGTKQGGFTPWHPVCTMEGWQFPAKIGTVERVETDAVYNFILAFGDNPIQDKVRPGSLIVDGMLACTLGHDMVGPVIGHPYFGRREQGQRNIIDDLREQPGWRAGQVTLSHVTYARDPTTGFICGLTAE